MTEPRDNPACGEDDPTRLAPQEGGDAISQVAAPNRDIKQIGSYRVIREIGTGGMGTVYLAEQQHPRRQVALKVIRRGATSEAMLRRFEFEAQALGRLRHPSVAQIYEAGTHDDGLGGMQYFAMEYVPNARTITAYADANDLSIRQRLQLFTQVCAAVHAGHQRGIIHRDLKPANILVDPSGQVKVIDFGVARASDSDAKTSPTQAGQLIGTIPYMSPEQCDGNPTDVDITSDVYSLGVTLYELLCGKLPYESSNVSVIDAIRAIREHVPVRPHQLDRRLGGDIETILLKALEKEPARRYASADEMSRDIARFLSHEPIEARPPTALYLSRMFMRRHKTLASSIGIVALVVLIAVVVLTTLVVRLNSRNVELDHVNQNLEEELYFTSVVAASGALSQDNLVTAKRRLDQAPERMRDWEWLLLRAQADQSRATLSGHVGALRSIAVSADGRFAASGGIDGLVCVWDAKDGRLLHQLRGHTDEVWSVAFHPEDSLLASGGQDGVIRLWDPRSGASVGDPLETGQIVVKAIAFAPTGDLITASYDNRIRPPYRSTVQVWEMPSGNLKRTLPRYDAERVWCLAVSPDGRHAVTSGHLGVILLWDLQTAQILATTRAPVGGVDALAIFSDGQTLVACTEAKALMTLSLPTLSVTNIMEDAHEDWIYSAAFSPQGRFLATGSVDKHLVLRDAKTLEPIVSLQGHEAGIRGVAFDPSQPQRIWTASEDGTVKIWETAGQMESNLWNVHSRQITALAVSKDGDLIASASVDGVVHLWSAHDRTKVGTITLEAMVIALSFLDDRRLAAVTHNACEVIDLFDPRQTVRIEAGPVPIDSYLVVGHDQMVLGRRDGQFDVYDAKDLSLVRTIKSGGAVAWWMVADASQHRGVFGLRRAEMPLREALLWDLREFRPIAPLVGHDNVVTRATFSPDQKQVATTSKDMTIMLWDASSGDRLGTLRGHEGFVQSATYIPSVAGGEPRLLTGSSDGTLKLWEIQRAEDLLTISESGTGTIEEVAVLPDGLTAIYGTQRGGLHFLDTVPYFERALTRRNALRLREVMASVIEQRQASGATQDQVIEQVLGESDPQRRAAGIAVLLTQAHPPE